MVHYTKKRLASGFTLTEAVVVMIIVSVLIALAIPRFQWEIARVRSGEGHQILMALYSAQINYRRDNAGNFASKLTDLDAYVDVSSSPPRYFSNVKADDGSSTVGCGGAAVSYVAKLEENNSRYSLYALTDGRVICKPCPGVCQKIGYPIF